MSKRMEHFYLDRFLEKRSEYSVVEADRESPDVVLRDSLGLIGFDVTQMFRDDSRSGSPTRAQESHRDAHLREVRRHYMAADGPPVAVTARLTSRPNLDPADVARLLIAQRPAAELEKNTVIAAPGHEYRLLALPANFPGEPHWQAIENRMGLVSRSSLRPAVQARIVDKSAKLGDYRRACPRVGLLLVIDRTHPSGMVEWNETEHSFDSSGFDTVLLYHYPFDVFELS
jgi:hypothetical protein